MPDSRALRLGLITGLLGVLFVLFVAYGAGVGVSDGPPYDESAVIHEPETALGEQIEVSGVVVSLDPVQIDIGHADGSTGFVVENAPDVDVGQQLTVAGVLVDERTVDADRERTVVRDTWELQYMYAISVLAAVLVAGRIANEWRFRSRDVLFEPRDQTLYDQYVRGDTDG